MTNVYVKCKNEECRLDFIVIENEDISKNQLASILLKKSYYLCQRCGKVLVYSLEDHYLAD